MKGDNLAVLLVFLIVILVGSDQIIKMWAVENLSHSGGVGRQFIHIGDFRILDLNYLENDGAIFGSMSGQKWFLVGVTSIVIAVGIVAMFRYMKKSKFVSLIICLFVAGGIGNLIDRIRLGYVVDMFEIKLFDFAIFNFADMCVTIAFCMALVYTLFIEPKLEKAEKKAEVEGDE